MNSKTKKYLVVAAILTLLAYSFITWFLWPEASFESSDGGWSDSEILLKNRDFQSMAYFFELYKIKCNANNAFMVRTTKVSQWNIFYWPSYIVDKKWKIPYRKPSENKVAKGCLNLPQSEDITNTAISRARWLLNSL